MNDIGEQFHAWRVRLLATLDMISAGALQVLAADLRQTASAIEVEIRERAEDTERRDARLYRQRGGL